MTDIQAKLIAELRNMFQFDQSDLDFGIYRIMAMKRTEITRFLESGLPAQITEGLTELRALERSSTAQKRVEEIEKNAGKFGFDIQTSAVAEEYNNLKAELVANIDVSEIERDIYNHLYEFFSRYYDEGDFISRRRYKDGVYAIPYEGEEVKLHWANADQYYVKTSENFRDYSFRNESGWLCQFKLVDAQTERDNNKAREKRLFQLRAETPFDLDDHNLTIFIEYKAGEKKQEAYISDIVAALQAAINSGENTYLNASWLLDTRDGKTRLERELIRYTARNTFDYFIHKDLAGFLNRELDFFIKSEVFYIDDVDEQSFAHTRAYITKAKVLRKIARKIIAFLAQIENFQKMLWLKKKFVVETNWCITLDRIGEDFYPEIIANAAQLAEWRDMYAIDEIQDDLVHVGHSDPLTVEFLRQNANLVLDTKHFSADFKERLIASIDRLDEQTGGVLIHGENAQALRFLYEKYKRKIDCVHIDPPYNTDTNPFLYKNAYKHSSWASMMFDRIEYAYCLLDEQGEFTCHIDENEYELLYRLFEYFPMPDAGTIIWNKLNPMLGGRGIAVQHEYIIFRSPTDSSILASSEAKSTLREYAKQAIRAVGTVNDEARAMFARLVSSNADFSGGDKAYHLLDDEGNIYRLVAMGAPEKRTDPKFYIPLAHPITGKACPVPANGWSRTPETLQNLLEKGMIVFGSDETTQPQKIVYLNGESVKQLSSVINDGSSGKAVLDKYGFSFPYAHPVSLYELLLSANDPQSIIDYFAGSGTTGHAVINLNRSDNGNRKYILVEMGEYFDTVTLPRMKKVVYSADWKDGKPQKRNTGVSHIMKYMTLESYEDALANIVLPESVNAPTMFREEYLLKYMLNVEAGGASLLPLEKLATPFDYRLKVTRKNESKETVVDLPETFNYLIGLSVTKSHARVSFGAMFAEGQYGALTATLTDGDSCTFKAVEGTLPGGETALVIWRSLTDDIQKDNAALDAYRARFGKYKKVFVNGDCNLEHVLLIEEIMKQKMFEEV